MGHAAVVIALAGLLGQAPGTPRVVTEAVRILRFGGFEVGRATRDAGKPGPGDALVAERAALPRGWASVTPDVPGALALDPAVHREGARSLRVTPGAARITVESAPASLAGSRRVSAVVWRRGGSGEAALRWIGAQGPIRDDPLPPRRTEAGWTCLERVDLAPPAGAQWVAMRLEAAAGEPVWWDGAAISGAAIRPSAMRVLVNQVGYELGAPKRFTVQANFHAAVGSFAIVRPNGSVAWRGRLTGPVRAIGSMQADWGSDYWRGDMTAFDRPGRYVVRASLDGRTDTSFAFSIGRGLLEARTAVPGYRFFWFQRCGVAVPGYHGPCHLDDAADRAHTVQLRLAGGWHDAGDYNKYHNAPYVFGLATAFRAAPQAFGHEDRDHNGRPDLVDEIVWGALHVARMVQPDGSVPGEIYAGYNYAGPPELETDNVPGTGDERPVSQLAGRDPAVHAAALARTARFAAPERAALVRAAERAMGYAMRKGLRGMHLFCAAVDLAALTGSAKYTAFVRKHAADYATDDPIALREADLLLRQDHRAAARARIVREADAYVALADPAFGLRRFGSTAAPSYFNPPSADGTGGSFGGYNHELIAAAVTALQAYRLTRDDRYRVFAYDQLNWVLGTNPFDLCMMEGQGSRNPPTYHQAQRFGRAARGAIPGGIVNGISWRGPEDDRPAFDMRPVDMPDARTSEVWLPHNTAWMQAMAALHLARTR